MLATLAILVAAIILFVTEKLRVDVVALGVVVSLMLTGVLSTNEALAGFSNSAVLTIASLFIVGGAVLQTGLAAMIADRIIKVAGTNETRLIVTTQAAAAMMSGFMSDTGVVAVMLPAIISLANRVKVSASRLLIPLAYGSLIGGAMTLIGTPPNIIVADLLRDQGLEPFAFFSYTPLGLLIAASGIIFMLLVGRRLLPDRTKNRGGVQLITPHELVELYKLPDGLFQLRVRGKSHMEGKTLEEAQLRSQFQVNILEIRRTKQARNPRRAKDTGSLLPLNGYTSVHPTLDTIFQVDDVLIAAGTPDDVSRAAAQWNLGVQPVSPDDRDMLITHEVGIAEVIIRPRSSLVGKTLKDAAFSATYHLTVLEIERPGFEERLDTDSTALRTGDILLVQGKWADIFALKSRERRNFIVMGETEALAVAVNREKAPVALAIMVGMLFLMITGWVSVTGASMLAGLAIILTGCLSMDDAYNAIDWKSIVLIAGMLPMSTALEKVGLVELVASGFTEVLGSMGPMAILAALFLMTSVFTQVLSNTATAVLIAPIAFATATSMGVQPHAFLMAVAVAASMAFASPVASPVNALVMGAGNYRFSDYAKVGIPMILIALIISVIVLPILWPF
ncbi:MAG: SLC13 family permease [Anaerolineae bacterium]|nr:SLC13 family permease [Anaerolineae bacterium]